MSRLYDSCRLEAKTEAGAMLGEQARKQTLLLEYWELTKPRLSLLSVITAIVGYLAALPERSLLTLFSLALGTSLAAGGAAALNQWAERESDARMARTRGRPIPAGLVDPTSALVFGLAICVVGDALLWYGVRPLCGILALATQVSYVMVYTPMKLRTRWNTEVGAIPGALPPLIGWAAAETQDWALGWIIFAILLFWQIPHFMAIAWMYRKDYAKADYKMLTVVEPTGAKAARSSLFFTVLLIAVSLLPFFLGYTSPVYAIVAALFGAWFFKKAVMFFKTETRDAGARKLFLASIAYLPVVLAALVLDRWFIPGL